MICSYLILGYSYFTGSSSSLILGSSFFSLSKSIFLNSASSIFYSYYSVAGLFSSYSYLEAEAEAEAEANFDLENYLLALMRVGWSI